MGTPGRARLGVAFHVALRFAAATCVASSCAGKAEPQVTISAVTPAMAFSGAPIDIVIEGGPFRPIFDVDTITGRETTELGAFTAFIAPSSGQGTAFPVDSLMWLSTSQLAAELQGDVPPGVFDVEVRDPRGSMARLAGGFVSLGPDRTPPVVTIAEPVARTIVNVGSEVPVAFEADDGPGFVTSMTWKVSTPGFEASFTCPLAPSVHRATCRYKFVVPTPQMNGQPLAIVVTAADSTNPPAQAETTLAIGLPPVASAFSPSEGPSTGGTQLAVHGRNFISGTQVLVGGALLQPNGGILVSDTLIQGTTPAHDAGLGAVTVRSGAISADAPGTFLFVGQPEVRAVAPTSGPLAGCTPIAIVGKNFRPGNLTTIWFGSVGSAGAPLVCPTWISPSRIEGYTPPGAGAVAVFAGDPTGGVSELPLAFTYLDSDSSSSSDAGAPATCPCDGGAP